MKNKYYYSVILLILSLFLTFSACATDPLKDAFKGNYSPGKNNKIIDEYCQSCHVHSKFVPDLHVDEMNVLYKKRLFANATECRICHYLDKNIFGDTIRKHRRPKFVNKGMFNSFIKKERAERADKKNK